MVHRWALAFAVQSCCCAALLLSPHPQALAQASGADATASSAQVPATAFIDPRELAALDDTLLFNAYHPTSGQALWAFKPGTGDLQTINATRPGFRGASPNGLVRFGQHIYLAMDDGDAGLELWRSDGTRAGTQLVKDINTGPGGATPAVLTVFNGSLFFIARSADDQAHRLWQTQGDAATTRPVAGAAQLDNPAQLTVVGDKLFFTATHGATGRELWVLDSPRAAPRLVKDIRPGAEDAMPTQLTAAGGLLFFVATDGVHGWELWRSDGSSVGTRMARDIRGGPDASRPSYLAALGRQLLFAADDGRHGVELWRSDGSEGGTVLVKDIRAGADGAGISELTALDGLVFLSATDGVQGAELWKSDGTAAGTALVADLVPGPGSALPNALARIGQRLFFAAADAGGVQQPWLSDGTAAGTRRVGTALVAAAFGARDPSDPSDPGDPGAASYPFPSRFTAVGNAVLFVAKNKAGDDRLWLADAQGRVRLVGAEWAGRVR